MTESKRTIRRNGFRIAMAMLGAAMSCAGCGSDDGADAPVPSMLGPASAERSSDGPNRLPMIESVMFHPARPAPGRRVRADVSVSDPDGDRTSLSYRWRTKSGQILGDGRVLNTTGLDDGAAIEVVVTAADEEGESAPFVQGFVLGGASLEIAHVAIDASGETKRGVLLEAVVETTNEDEGGYETLYEWTVGGEVVGAEEVLDTTTLAPGAVVTVAARLEFEDRTTRPIRSIPFALDAGGAPRIESQPTAGIEGGLFRYAIRARSDEPGTTFAYSLTKGPEGMIVDGESGVLTWRPTKDQRGAFAVEVVAKDQWGSGIAQSFSIQVDGPEGAPPASAR